MGTTMHFMDSDISHALVCFIGTCDLILQAGHFLIYSLKQEWILAAILRCICKAVKELFTVKTP